MTVERLPVSNAWLERYRLASERNAPRSRAGVHLQRRKGASLEFRDFQPYCPGDDFRRIDWVASARRPSWEGEPGKDWLIRNYVAEENLCIVISVDTRATMQGPDQPVDEVKLNDSGLRKATIAAWLAEAIARVALSGENRVVIHNLFVPKVDPIAFQGSSGQSRLGYVISRLAHADGASEANNFRCLDTWLPPAAFWIVISDFYIGGPAAAALAARVKEARRGYRSTIAIELDSWPQERNWVREGEFEILGPGVSESQNPRYELREDLLEMVESEIRTCKDSFFGPAQLPSGCRSHWAWPSVEREDAADFFRRQFKNDRVLQSIFTRKD